MSTTQYSATTKQFEAELLNDAAIPDDPPYLEASDGLPARKSGEWAKRKHHYLNNYCGITTVSMKCLVGR